jgi:hypothetical protein
VTWLVEVLVRNGIVPAEHIAEQIIEAIPRAALEEVLEQTAAAILAMRGVRAAADLSRVFATRGAAAVLTELHTGDIADEDGPPS